VQPTRKLILASSSPRRRDLLRDARFDFTVRVPDVDETTLPGETAAACTQRLALAKARVVVGELTDGECVLAADTLVVLAEAVLGKPRDAAEAVAMLTSLAGRTHRVLTGYAVLCPGEQLEEFGVAESRVTLRALSRAEIDAYVATGEPLDKAGAYALQGEAGRFVTHIDGSRSNVVGLPLEVVGPLLERCGVARR
jgi:septum formation protein